MSWGEIKYAINSTLGTSGFLPLDKLIQYNINKANGKDVAEFVSPGDQVTHIPIWANRFRLTAAAGGGGGYNENKPGGGGGGAAVLNQIYTIPDTLKGTNIVVHIGSSGKGRYSVYDESTAEYTNYGPTDGGNTTISAFNINLAGGKSGKAGAGGAAGGAGGGAGAIANSTAGAGISGSGGSSNSSAGGGGGSLGSGGNGKSSTSNSDVTGGSGSRGGGGGAAYSSRSTSYSKGGNGGTGYAKIEWLL